MIFHLLVWMTCALLSLGAIRQTQAQDIPNVTISLQFLPKCSGSNLRDEIPIPGIISEKNVTITYKLKEQSEMNCTSFIHKINLQDGKKYPEKISSIYKFYRNGMFKLNNSYFMKDQYCISSFDQDLLTLSLCNISCAPHGPFLCIPKCCAPSEVVRLKYTVNEEGVEEGSQECVPSGTDLTWTPLVYSSKDDFTSNESLPLEKDHIPKRIHIIQHFPKTFIFPSPHKPVHFNEDDEPFFEETKFHLLDNGSLVELFPVLQRLSPCSPSVSQYFPIIDEFCVDGLVVEDEVYGGREIDQIFFALPPEEKDQDKVSELYTRIKAGFLYISIIFLILTITMYLIIWNKHNIHGWTVFSFVVSMMVFFVIIGIVHSVHLTAHLEFLKSGWCTLLAVLSHFTFLCTISWMTVINFDLWATFRNLAPSREKKNLVQYFCYFAFAMGVPVLIVGFSLIIHFSADYEEDHFGTLPGYAQAKYCSLHPCSQKYFLFTPIAIMLGCNLVMFSSTVMTLWTYKQKTINAGGSTANGPKQSWILFCKLFLVMGITWIFEVLSGFLEWELIIFDVINVLQAVAIFFIFAAKRENLLWIYKRHPTTRGVLGKVLRMRLCYVAELDGEHTEMTSAEKNRTLVVAFRSRLSTGSDSSGGGGSRMSKT